MYWELMRRAAERGLGTFDFGRSKRGTGSFKFKEHWGFEAAAACLRIFPGAASAMPNLSPTNPKYRFFIDTWKRLPLWLTRRVGPLLARHLG